ncbi:MAG: cysteine desulfurase [Candidatus Bathyarchaeota archaeon]|nr:MAG: cysteine desulfurase [Candidatus Bathyarchaeota archaeon]
MRKVYVDYAASTPVDPRVVVAMQPYFTRFYGNASSLSSFGVEAKQALEQARETIARLMGAKATELVFTGSATEANNLALKGHAFKEGKSKCHIAISEIEHSSILNTARWLETQGVRVTFLPVDKYGLLKIAQLEEALKKQVTLVSVVHGNNEIGSIQPIEIITNICHKYGALFHTDAVQSFGKLPIDVNKMNIDLMTINAHKMYGPKGVGALYLNRDNAELDPLIHGGGHEFGLRAGTQNVPGIVGFGKAVELRRNEMQGEEHVLTKLRDALIKGVLELKDTYLNGHPSKRLPNNANFRFSYIEGEALVLDLDGAGIATSSGSACSSMAREASHVLLAIGLKQEEARGSLRFSLGKYNNEEDIDYILQVLPEIVKRLRSMSPLQPKAETAQTSA